MASACSSLIFSSASPTALAAPLKAWPSSFLLATTVRDSTICRKGVGGSVCQHSGSM
jgi:hypothetical protein